MSTVHVLKTWPSHWRAVSEGRKTFEVREHDRDFALGDVVDLVEFDPGERRQTGYVMRWEIGTVLTGEKWGLMPGYCAFSLVRRVG